MNTEQASVGKLQELAYGDQELAYGDQELAYGDHFSSLYSDLPRVRLQPLDGVLRAAARMIGGVPKFGHISECMRDTLH